jgi:hypothetical protein
MCASDYYDQIYNGNFSTSSKERMFSGPSELDPNTVYDYIESSDGWHNHFDYLYHLDKGIYYYSNNNKLVNTALQIYPLSHYSEWSSKFREVRGKELMRPDQYDLEVPLHEDENKMFRFIQVNGGWKKGYHCLCRVEGKSESGRPAYLCWFLTRADLKYIEPTWIMFEDQYISWEIREKLKDLEYIKIDTLESTNDCYKIILKRDE